MNTYYDLSPAYGRHEIRTWIALAAIVIGVIALVVAATVNPAMLAVASVSAVAAISLLAHRSTSARITA